MRRYRILLTGSEGQLGQAIIRLMPEEIKPCADMTACSHANLDIAQADAVKAVVNEIQPDVVINTAAYKHVDLAEQNEQQAYAVNCSGVRHLAMAAQQNECAIFHISTDYVFNGERPMPYTPYTEQDLPDPVNAYGRTKLAGEKALLALHSRALVIRTSCLFGGEGSNFVNSIVQKARTNAVLEVVNDQISCPTHVDDLAQVLWQLITHYLNGNAMSWGVFHYAGQYACSRYEWACKIVEAQKAKAKEKGHLQHEVRVIPVSTKSQTGIAKRPMYTALDSRKIKLAYKVIEC